MQLYILTSTFLPAGCRAGPPFKYIRAAGGSISGAMIAAFFADESGGTFSQRLLFSARLKQATICFNFVEEMTVTNLILKTGGLTLVLAVLALFFLTSTGQPAFGEEVSPGNKKPHHHKRHHAKPGTIRNMVTGPIDHPILLSLRLINSR